ncbi:MULTISPECIES: DUF503 domain-containing protein [Gracilibacillus]|uniref:DUF503 domain-containing protein n=1 Tax=Gracilibacillus dipsosauri TaxID=178340 RepID=A0A317L1B5_9BACI|nr:DUF503 domain-containing protein [Gracilibacillus dipsosauri]PWU68830.1 DUF503 domain-containing protein [Gracilibacillus dipsosauri]
MLLYAEIEFILYDCHSLKEKRSILLRLKNRLNKNLNLAIAEIDHQNQWQRAAFAIVTVSDAKVINEKVIQQALALMDSFPEIERTTTDVEER